MGKGGLRGRYAILAAVCMRVDVTARARAAVEAGWGRPSRTAGVPVHWCECLVEHVTALAAVEAKI